MANRRMFSKGITSSSGFLMMPVSARELYFQLGMNADDDGFCEHFAIMRMTEAKPDDLHIIAVRGFVRIFDDKVLIITDWKENNYIQSDRYTPSKYLEIYKQELDQISQEAKNLSLPIGGVYKADTQVRLGKVSIENNIGDAVATPSQIAKDFFGDDIKRTGMITEWFGKSSELLTEVTKFIDYWTELNKSGTKQRWQLEKTFEVKRRLNTWFSRSKSFQGYGQRDEERPVARRVGSTDGLRQISPAEWARGRRALDKVKMSLPRA